MEVINRESNAQACIEAGKELGKAKILELDGKFFKQEDGRLVLVEELLKEPNRLVGCRSFESIEGFCAYVDDFQSEDTRIYGSLNSETGNTKIKAVLDDHANSHEPGWQMHTATLYLYHSKEWVKVENKDQQGMGQREFAEFLEDNISLIAKPDASELLKATKCFQIRKNVVCDATLDGPNVSFAVREESQAESKTSGVQLPREIVFALRPFKNSHPRQVKANIRYRFGGDKMTFHYSLVEPEKVVEKEFEHVCFQVKEKLKLPVLI